MVQSLKKLEKKIQKWSLNCIGWYIADTDATYDISQLSSQEYGDMLFYKESWITANELEQRIIVTFSFKYKEYLHI